MDNNEIIYTVIIQTPAVEMLVEHARFLAQVSIAAAERLADEFYTKAKSLENIPERCPWLSGYSIPEKNTFRQRFLFFEYEKCVNRTVPLTHKRFPLTHRKKY